MSAARPVVLAITGASGAPYGVRLLEVLARHRVSVWLIASSANFDFDSRNDFVVVLDWFFFVMRFKNAKQWAAGLLKTAAKNIEYQLS